MGGLLDSLTGGGSFERLASDTLKSIVSGTAQEGVSILTDQAKSAFCGEAPDAHPQPGQDRIAHARCEGRIESTGRTINGAIRTQERNFGR